MVSLVLPGMIGEAARTISDGESASLLQSTVGKHGRRAYWFQNVQPHSPIARSLTSSPQERAHLVGWRSPLPEMRSSTARLTSRNSKTYRLAFKQHSRMQRSTTRPAFLP